MRRLVNDCKSLEENCYIYLRAKVEVLGLTKMHHEIDGHLIAHRVRC